MFAKYSATVDNPGCCVWRELKAAYPDATVLLTHHPRGVEAWYRSTMETIYFTETMWQFKFLKRTTPFARKLGDMTQKLVWQRSHKGSMANREAAIVRYAEHVAEVKAAVPAEKLLELSVDQGWAPLYEFLGVPVPESEFPNVNDRGGVSENYRRYHQERLFHPRASGRSPWAPSSTASSAFETSDDAGRSGFAAPGTAIPPIMPSARGNAT